MHFTCIRGASVRHCLGVRMAMALNVLEQNPARIGCRHRSLVGGLVIHVARWIGRETDRSLRLLREAHVDG